MPGIDSAIFLWSPYGIGQTIIFSSCRLFFLLSSFFSSPNLSRRRLDVCHTSTHGVACLSANFRCRSETCCMWLAENTGRKKVDKNRHLGTIAQLCWAISSQLRHVSTHVPTIWWTLAEIDPVVLSVGDHSSTSSANLVRRVTTCLENPEMLENLIALGEISEFTKSGKYRVLLEENLVRDNCYC